MTADPKPGDVYFVDLGLARKARNILIVSVRDANTPLAIITGLSLTTQYHRSPYEVVLPKLPWLRE
jgi:mRNA interferase MazF